MGRPWRKYAAKTYLAWPRLRNASCTAASMWFRDYKAADIHSPNRGVGGTRALAHCWRCLAVQWWWLSIALATSTWRRASAADPPPTSFRPVGFTRFWGWGWEKRLQNSKMCFGVPFWTLVLPVFCCFFGACQARKHCNLQCFCAFGMKKVVLATCKKPA